MRSPRFTKDNISRKALFILKAHLLPSSSKASLNFSFFLALTRLSNSNFELNKLLICLCYIYLIYALTVFILSRNAHAHGRCSPRYWARPGKFLQPRHRWPCFCRPNEARQESSEAIQNFLEQAQGRHRSGGTSFFAVWKIHPNRYRPRSCTALQRNPSPEWIRYQIPPSPSFIWFYFWAAVSLPTLIEGIFAHPALLAGFTAAVKKKPVPK